ncbi:hypothetical protein FNV43_RR00012 [Rhamnella rubrinervis]|uniref:Beta-glucosidase n=1 Tax=Rhamnella rubrinervis TaxID=2594499 RepID=A0A8K0MRH8_9ROSA|nr:hypothetical protein FNV43_RR00012 [Rhamnella rubrinervis]
MACLLSFLLLVESGTNEAAATASYFPSPFNRTLFPPDFIFGAGSSAYQIEGAAHLDGKGPNNWDTFTENHPGQMQRSDYNKELLMSSAFHDVHGLRITSTVDSTLTSGVVAADFYHRYKEDIQLMKQIGLENFRFSISWSRVLPTGRINGGVNQQGVQFYNNLIDELLSNGIVPFVTIFHWDVPQALEDEYGGFLSSRVVKDYEEYADFLFKTFGDRVKNWCTINEPTTFTLIGYDLGINAPGRCSDYTGNCTAGDSATEPYIVAHNLLLAHAAGAKVYKEKYQFNTQSNQKATSRALDFSLGWFLHPITYGVGDPITLPFNEAIKDSIRIRYIHSHLLHILKAIKEGANVKAYYSWTFLDDFEWARGYTNMALHTLI